MLSRGTTGRVRRRLVVGALVAVIAALAALVVSRHPGLVACHVPVRHGAGFHDMVARADRLIVRDGIFDCCGPDRGGQVLFVVTDPATLEEIGRHVRFMKGESKDSLGASCMCCGGPRLDWYRGERRLALTALQHGRDLRWKGFSTMRLFGFRVAYGDAPLTETSARWLAAFLSAKSGRDFALEPVQPARWASFGAKPDQDREDSHAVGSGGRQAELVADALLGAPGGASIREVLAGLAPPEAEGRWAVSAWAEGQLARPLLSGDGTGREWDALCLLRDRHRVFWLDEGETLLQLLASRDSPAMSKLLDGDACAARIADDALAWAGSVGDAAWSCCDGADRVRFERAVAALDVVVARGRDAAGGESAPARALADRFEQAASALRAWDADCSTACR